jgi:protein arginine kinase
VSHSVQQLELHGFRLIGGQWLRAAGPEHDIVISSRIRLARNLSGLRFPARMDAKDRAHVIDLVGAAFRGNGVRFDLDSASSIDRAFLVERRLISKELAGGEGARAVFFGHSEAVSIMVNEEDHLRIQCIRSGFDLDRAWRAISRVDRALQTQIPMAFHDTLGFLTSCPTNVGTGMRVSVMLHLPALTMKDHIGRVQRAVDSMNLAMRGLYGEGTQPAGDFYQISNQATLGRSETELVATLRQLVPPILRWERGTRDAMLAEERPAVEDRIARAVATLRAAKQITVEETLSHLSMLRLGISTGLIPQEELTIAQLNELFMLAQPAHLQKRERRSLTPEERDLVRADLIRSRLAKVHLN